MQHTARQSYCVCAAMLLSQMIANCRDGPFTKLQQSILVRMHTHTL